MLNAFGDWEETKYPSNHRYIGTVAGGPNAAVGILHGGEPELLQPVRPGRIPDNSYNWNSQTKDTTWMLGVGVDWPVDGRMDAEGVVPLREERRAGDASARRTMPPLRRTRSTSATSTTPSSSTST